jgi:hypothetical protein
MRNPNVVAQQLFFASTAYQVLRDLEGTITYGELDARIQTPWPVRGDTFGGVLAIIAVLHPDMYAKVVLSTGERSPRAIIWQELLAEYDTRVAEYEARVAESKRTINDYERATEALAMA